MCDTCDEAAGIVIPTGQDGDDGTNGIYGGYSSKWLFDTSTGSAPSATFLRLNNATYSSVTTIYIHETNGDSTDLSGFLASFVNSSNYGNIRLFKETNSNVFWMGTITNVVDSGAYYTLTVTHNESNGSFSASDPVVVSFSAKGASGSNGSNGTDGEDGVAFIYANTTQSNASNNSPSYTNLASTTIVANKFNANGDGLKWTVLFTKTTTAYTYGVKLVVDNNSVTNPIVTLSLPAQYKEGKFDVEIIRTSATAAYMYVQLTCTNSINTLINVYAKQTRAVPIDFAQTITLSAQYLTNNASAIFYQEEMYVENYNYA